MTRSEARSRSVSSWSGSVNISPRVAARAGDGASALTMTSEKKAANAKRDANARAVDLFTIAMEVVSTYHIMDTRKLFPLAHLLKERGVIDGWREVSGEFPDEPRLFAFESHAGAGTLSNGADALDRDAAQTRMLAEAYERSRWRAADLATLYETRAGTPAQMTRDGNTAAPCDFEGFTRAELDSNPLLRHRDDAPYAWVQLPSSIGEEPAWLPLQTAGARYHEWVFRRQRAEEPLVRPLSSAGLATAPTKEGAMLAGLLELIERDAAMIWYLDKLPASRIPDEVTENSRALTSLLGSTRRYNLRVRLFSLPTDFPVHVVAALVEDDSGHGPALTVGSKASFSLEEAAQGALTEALYNRLVYRREHLERRSLPQNRRDWGPLERVAFWGTAGAGALSFLDAAPAADYSLTTPDLASAADALSLLARVFREKKIGAWYADLTDTLGKELGFYSIAAIAPGLQPMHLHERVPCRGGTRLRSVPQALGFAAANTVNEMPHPFP